MKAHKQVMGGENVTKYIEQKILNENQTISMSVVHEIFNEETACNGTASEKSKYRHKLKQKLINSFGEKLLFLSPRTNVVEIVIRSDTVESHVDFSDKDTNIVRVANYLRNDILEYCSSLSI